MQDSHQQLYNFFYSIRKKFNPRDYIWDYQSADPVPFIVLDNFLPEELFKIVSKEYTNIPSYLWNNFTRNGSFMEECKTLENAPLTQTLTNCLNSGVFVDWLEHLTNHEKLVTDCHSIGAGISKTTRGNSLKLHTDFNWNDEIALNRALSLILYINPVWETAWGGELEFWDFEKTKVIHSISPMPNRLLIWNYDSRFIHGYPDALECPEDVARLTLRVFYYQSDSQPREKPHRSLYWWDKNTNQPIDNRSQK
jgi:hypothetical protein